MIFNGFRDYRQAFEEITSGAQMRFLAADWQGAQSQSQQRIRLYKQSKRLVCDEIMTEAGIDSVHAITMDTFDWIEIKASYASLVESRTDAALAGTFYNTIFRALMPDVVLREQVAFVETNPIEHHSQARALTRKFRGANLSELIADVLKKNELGAWLTNPAQDIENVAERLKAEIPLLRSPTTVLIEMVSRNFYRNKGAYHVGRLVVDGHMFPLAIAFGAGKTAIQAKSIKRNVAVDAVLWGEPRLSIIFSFTRSYFMVESSEPSQLVNYLQTLLPEKKRWELYASLGFFKHGKTEFVRDLWRDLRQTSSRFEISEGIKGQVMLVFGLASFQTVFKVMRDKFPATKNIDHDGVRAAYKLVKTHDRVGRMADTHEFRNLTLPREKFAPEVLAALIDSAPDQIELTESDVTIRHLYTERMMVPLNLYVKRCSEFQLKAVMNDYGNAIKELAAANIFPGDMLLKNFGVTRHGRVVFYDYDEICYLTQINFREMPERDARRQDATAEAWFDVGEYDVFPEEFSRFLFPDDHMMAIFSEHHADLFRASGWRAIQAEVEQNIVMDVFPYPLRERLG